LNFLIQLFLTKRLTVNKKMLPLVLIALLALVLLFVKKFKTGDSGKSQNQVTKDENQNPDVNRNRGFDRRVSYIEYTEHAKCRMQCRKVSQSEVEEIMRGGKINYSKSDVNERPCPTYALEGITHDNQRVRVVFAQCDFKTKVVTTIDLDTEWECECPGDDSKHKNK
jgi:hypothetical protein